MVSFFFSDIQKLAHTIIFVDEYQSIDMYAWERSFTRELWRMLYDKVNILFIIIMSI